MANRYIAANGQFRPAWREFTIVSYMQDTAILYVGPLTDSNRMNISSNRTTWPDGTVFADDDITGDYGTLIDKCCFIDLRYMVFKATNIFHDIQDSLTAKKFGPAITKTDFVRLIDNIAG